MLSSGVYPQRRSLSFYFNELHVGDHIRMRLPGDRRWSRGQCRRVLGQRSYEVEVNGSRYRRNRRQLRSAAELPNMDTTIDDVESMHHQDETLHENRMTKAAEVHRGPEYHDTPPRPVSTPRRPIGDGPGTPEVPTPPVPKPRQSIHQSGKYMFLCVHIWERRCGDTLFDYSLDGATVFLGSH